MYNKIIDVLNSHPELAKTKEFESFYKQFVTRKYKKGEMLIRADDDPQGIFCLSKGYVRQYTISKTGNELSMNRGPGSRELEEFIRSVRGHSDELSIKNSDL